jgi:heme-degrading monooxygenase HmoA
MLCAHTVRRLKPGTFDDFAKAFMPAADDAPAGWVRFHMLRGLADENEVVTFGFFDGTLEELERSQDQTGFEEHRAAVEEYVDAVLVNGVYDIAVSLVPDGASSS